MDTRVILHCDLNNFFASVACLENPAIAGLPVAVCGAVEDRHGICLAKNELAKKCGIRTGDTVATVQRKCPGVVIVPPMYGEYELYSRRVTEIYGRFTDLVEPFGCDECWLDVSGSGLLFGDGVTIAETIRQTVKRETGLTISVGVSFNKIFAKLGSDMKKPDAVSVISKERFRELVWPLPVRELLGVGGAVAKALEKRGVTTVGQLAATPPEYLHHWLGKTGITLWEYANGMEGVPVIPRIAAAPLQSISHGMTPRRDLKDKEEAVAFIRELSQEVGQRLRENGMTATGVRVSVKDTALVSRDFQTTLCAPTAHTETIAKAAIRLFLENYRWVLPVRAISVGTFKLTESTASVQLGLWSDTEAEEREASLDGVMDALRTRYGTHSIHAASYLLLTKEGEGAKSLLHDKKVWNPAYSLGERGKKALDGG